MREPVLGELDLCMPLSGSSKRTYTWIVEKRLEEKDNSAELNEGERMMESLRSVCVRSESEPIFWYKKASYSWAFKFGGWQRSYQHHTISRGTAVSIVVDGDTSNRVVIKESADMERGLVEYYAVYGIMWSAQLGPWCVVRKLQKRGEGYSVDNSPVALLHLGRRVRRVAIFHICDRRCTVHAGRLKVRHSKSVLHGGVYTIKGRGEGYPPHLG